MQHVLPHALSVMDGSQGRYDMYGFVHNALRSVHGVFTRSIAPVVPFESAASAEASTIYDDSIWVPGRNGSVRVPVERIDWIEAARDYVLLNTSIKAHMMRATMGELEKRLDPAIMVRIHRSYFVRIATVSMVRRHGKGTMRLQLSDGRELQVGLSYVAAVVKALKLSL